MAVSVLREDGWGIATFHMAVPGTSGDAACTLGFTTGNNDGQVVADKLSDAWATTVMDVIDGNVVYHGATTLHRIGGNLESWISHQGDPTPGSGGNYCAPAQVAVLVQKRTGLAGKKNRGRFYLPGLWRDNVVGAADPNTLKSAALTLYQTALDQFLAALVITSGGGAVLPAIIHPLPNPNQGTIILSFAVQARLATQRNRLRD